MVNLTRGEETSKSDPTLVLKINHPACFVAPQVLYILIGLKHLTQVIGSEQSGESWETGRVVDPEDQSWTELLQSMSDLTVKD